MIPSGVASKTLVWLTATLQAPAIGLLESYKFRPVSCRWEVGAAGCTWTRIPLFFGISGDSFPNLMYDPLALWACILLRFSGRARLWNVNSSCWPCWNNGRQPEGFWKKTILGDRDPIWWAYFGESQWGTVNGAAIGSVHHIIRACLQMAMKHVGLCK